MREGRSIHRAFGLFLLMGWIALAAHGQSRKDLEKKRDALDKQIRTTTALIEQARKEQKSAGQQVSLLEAQLRQREELIGTMTGELLQVERRIQENEAVLVSLNDDLVRLKEEYARMVQFAYYSRGAYDRLSYLFAAGSFQQAFKRSRYLSQLADYRRRQAVLIEETQASIGRNVEQLKAQRDERSKLLVEQESEKRRLAEDRTTKQSALAGLKKEEGRLKDQMRKQEKQRRDLDAAIRKAIEAELKAQQKAAGTAKGVFTLTPEAKELGADFEKNKGRLPWPVEKGTITSSFGRQPHPVLKGITIDNSGIDITTEKNAVVRAVFRGEVSSVIVIPGAGKAVIVSHGAYRSVYSNLREVSVSKGQKIETKQAVGTVMTTDEGNVAHLELWKITAEGMVKVDPGLWLFR